MPAEVPTRGTDERFAIRNLVDNRGISLCLSLFTGSQVSLQDVAKFYAGQPVDHATMAAVKRVLRERLTRD